MKKLKQFLTANGIAFAEQKDSSGKRFIVVKRLSVFFELTELANVSCLDTIAILTPKQK